MFIQEVLEKKIYQFKCCNDASSTKKKFMKKCMYWYAHEEPYVPHISNASNVHEVVDNNSNSYRNMIMDAIIMNQGHTSQYPTKYFVRISLLKDQSSLL